MTTVPAVDMTVEMQGIRVPPYLVTAEVQAVSVTAVEGRARRTSHVLRPRPHLLGEGLGGGLVLQTPATVVMPAILTMGVKRHQAGCG